MNNTIKFLIGRSFNGYRVDVFLSKNIKLFTRSYIKKLIETKQLKINGNIVLSPSFKLKINDKISFNLIEKNITKLIPNELDIDIIYEDKDIVVLNKPKGLVVHPGVGNLNNTLANALLYKFKTNLSNINGEFRPGIVHRLDKDTSGILVIAKNNLSHSNLGKQFSEHSIVRKYKCLVWGVVRPLKGRIETLISRDQKNRQLMSVSEFRGKKAITNYKTIKTFSCKEVPKISLIECELETGRTHQIRVHLKYKGVSLLGDRQYGKKNLKFKKSNSKFLNYLDNLKGQALHAFALGFNHPTKNKWVNFNTQLPEDFKKMLNLLDNLSR